MKPSDIGPNRINVTLAAPQAATIKSLKLLIRCYRPIGIGGTHECDKENLFNGFTCFDAVYLSQLCKQAGILDEGGRE